MAPVESLGLTVPVRSMRHLPGDAHNVLAAQSPGLIHDLPTTLRAGDDLRLAIAVSEVEEDRPAMVARAVDPTAKRHRLVHVLDVQFATIVRA